MDPDAGLRTLIEAAYAGNGEAVREAADALATWLEKGGFAPGSVHNA